MDSARSHLKKMQDRFRAELTDRIEAIAAEQGRLQFSQTMCSPASRFLFIDHLQPHLSGAILKMLSSGHHFGYETGRWNDIQKTERKCGLCLQRHDEIHALYDWSLFTVKRDKLLEILHQLNQPIVNLQEATRLVRPEHRMERICKNRNYTRLPIFLVLCKKCRMNLIMGCASRSRTVSRFPLMVNAERTVLGSNVIA